MRRTVPLVAAIAALLAAGSALAVPAGAFVLWLPAQVVLIHVAMHARRRTAVALSVLLAAVLYLGSVLVLGRSPLDPSALLLLTWTGAVLGAGLTIRAHRDRLRALADRAAAVLAARDSDIDRHVADERLRIARDLHDSLAHSVAVISISAGAAAHALPHRPDDAVASVSQVQHASRTVLAEMQQIVLLLRSEEGEEDAALTLPTLSSLVESARSLGDDIAVDVPADSELAALEPIVATTVVRVVQEGLTNARRYGSGPVSLTVDLDASRVVVAMENTVRSHQSTTASPSGGFGLVGMRERVTAIGGTVRAERIANRFEVRAEFPRTLAEGSTR